MLGESKVNSLFDGFHFEWIGMYIGKDFDGLISGDYVPFFVFPIDLLQKLRLFVKAKEVTKHCIEKQKIPLNYDPSAFDGAIILSAQSPTVKRLPNASSSSSINSSNKNLPPLPKDFLCSIWLVLIFYFSS